MGRKAVASPADESSSDSSVSEVEENDCIGGRFYVGKVLGSVNIYHGAFWAPTLSFLIFYVLCRGHSVLCEKHSIR